MKRVAIASALALILGVFAGTPTAQIRVGPNVNMATGVDDKVTGDPYLQRQNEVVIGISSINPDHMIAFMNDYRAIDYALDEGAGSPQQGILAKLWRFLTGPQAKRPKPIAANAEGWMGIGVSENGGKNWSSGLMYGYPGDTSLEGAALRAGGYEAAADPWMSCDPENCHVIGIAFTRGGPSALFYARFTDTNDSESGHNWKATIPPTVLRIGANALPGQFVDKPTITAAADGTVAVASVEFDGNDRDGRFQSKVLVSVSHDYGQTWSAFQKISQTYTRNQSPFILIDPNNSQRLYAGWRVFGDNTVVLRTSVDGGTSWGVKAGSILPQYQPFDQATQRLPLAPQFRTSAYPVAAIDGSGTLHLAITERTDAVTGLPKAGGTPRVVLTSSYDGGATWTPRSAIDFGPGTGPQFMPAITAVAEPRRPGDASGKTRSRIMVLYYDARASMDQFATGPIAGADKQFDVRIAQADPWVTDSAGRPVFEPSQLVSQYVIDPIWPHGVITAAGFGATSVNRPYPMFWGGTAPFTGDYNLVIPRVGYVRTDSGGWRSALALDENESTNELPGPVVQAVWADSRDVILPRNPPPSGNKQDPGFFESLGWWNYQKPGTANVPSEQCNAGSRNQNPYTAEITPGVVAGAPVTFKDPNLPRSYPLYVNNTTATDQYWRLTIEPGADASFSHGFLFPTTDERYTPPRLVTDIAVLPYSTVTGTVFVNAMFVAPVRITLQRIAAIDGALLQGADADTTVVTLNTSGGTDPLAAEAETHDAEVAPEAYVFTHPDPNVVDPYVQHPLGQNPLGQNPLGQNPLGQNPLGQNVVPKEITDVTFVVTNGGSTSSAYKALVAAQQNLDPAVYKFQILINRRTAAPGLANCAAVSGFQPVQVSSLKHPLGQNPLGQNPLGQNPLGQNPLGQNPLGQNPLGQNPLGQNPLGQNAIPSDNSTFYIAPKKSSGPNQSLSVASSTTFTSTNMSAAELATSGAVAARSTDEIWYTLRVFRLRDLVPGTDVAFDPTQVSVAVIPEAPDVLSDGAGGYIIEEPTPAYSAADLVAAPTLAGMPAAVLAGGVIDLPAMSVQNTGNLDAGVFRQGLYMRPSAATADVPWTHIGSGPDTSAVLAQGATAIVPGATSLVLPPSVTPGIYSVCAVADAMDVVPESSEANNLSCTTLVVTTSFGPTEILSSPGGGTASVPLSPPISVRLVDTNGTPVAGVALAVVLANSVPGASLSGGTNATTDAQGIATFSGLAITQAGPGYLLNVYSGPTIFATIGPLDIFEACSADGTGSLLRFSIEGPGIDSYPIATRRAGNVSGAGMPASLMTLHGNGTFSLLTSDFAGNFTPSFQFGFGADVPTAMATGDIDGDGDLDAAVVFRDASRARLVLPTGGTAPAPTVIDLPGKPYGVVLTDANRDGTLDLVMPIDLANAGTVRQVYVLPNYGGSFPPNPGHPLLVSPFSDITSITTADINGDGQSDLVLGTASGQVAVSLQVAFDLQEFAPSFDAGASAVAVASGDFNGDGRPDVAVADATGQSAIVLQNTTTGVTPTLGAPAAYALGAAPSSITTGDFNNDGWTDIAVTTPVALKLLFNNGDGTFGAPVSFGDDSEPVDVIAARLNSDLHVDLVVTDRLHGSSARDHIAVLMNSCGLRTADLEVTMDATPVFAVEGAQAYYDVYFTNNGEFDASGVQLWTDVPGEYLSYLISPSGDCVMYYPPRLVCDMVPIQPGATVRLTVRFLATIAGWVSATAAGVGSTLDLNPANNTAARPVWVGAVPRTFTVTNANDDGAGSLRQAILDANAHLNTAQDYVNLDTINFNIQPPGYYIISPLSPLPQITDSVTLDATTQPGYVDSPVIELDGTSAGPSATGLYLKGGYNTVRGFVINRFGGPGIQMRPYGSITFDPLGAGHNRIEGNYIGTDRLGMLDRGNGGDGVFTDTHDSVIGGPDPRQRNVISGNGGNGIQIALSAGTGNRVIGNYIGTNVIGTGNLPNDSHGVYIFGGADNHVGGVAAGEGNVISGNTMDGVAIASAGSTGNHVEGNIIGVDANCCGVDANPLRNMNGVSIAGGASGNVVGVSVVLGVARGKGNVISGNTGSGVYIATGASNNVVGGNAIGSDAFGDNTFSNLQHGVEIDGGDDTLIGGGLPESQNWIKYNLGAGVRILAGTRNRVENSRITANNALGIDLGLEGVTPNDSLDIDTGPNQLQNSPVLTSVITGPGGTVVQGTLHSTPVTTFFVEFRQNAVCDPSGAGEGDGSVGGTDVTTDDAGNGSFSASFTNALMPGNVMTAFATGPDGSSEYSGCFPIIDAGRGVIHGTVTDGSGAVLAGATVQIANVAGTFTSSAVTDRDGHYFLPDLLPDTYDISVSGLGTRRVTLAAAQVLVVNLP